ncbi:MAG: molybdopterin cofactor-binding domain-containing protein [Rhodoplanes sp.]
MRRIVGAYGAGRIVNPKTTRSQCIGGMIGGIGMALMEHSIVDARNGRVPNANLAEYAVPSVTPAPPGHGDLLGRQMLIATSNKTSKRSSNTRADASETFSQRSNRRDNDYPPHGHQRRRFVR